MEKIDKRRSKMANDFDKEYYVMSIDGENNHPLLNWGETDNAPFRKVMPIDETLIDLPLKVVFDEPYPEEPYEMADLLMLGVQRAGSGKIKTFFEKMNIYGVQFIPVEIKSNTEEIIIGHYAVHFWNRLRAIDKNNYVGSEPNRFGNIISLKIFSLDSEILNNTPLEKRLIFGLAENSMVIVHQSIYDNIQKENLTGIRFF
jgi:hypothetical protein